MRYQEAAERIASLRQEIARLREEMARTRQEVEAQDFADTRLDSSAGPVALSDLFGDKDNLIVIHNMGAGCSYCTMWADGFNGVYDHLAARASFVVASPDTPQTQRRFAESRGWRFPMVSYGGSDFAEACGYRRDGSFYPGVSIFTRKDGRIARVADEPFSPGDDFCIVWQFLSLLPQAQSRKTCRCSEAA
jgi:predicted dithiol-disulfide oxidoreductase (DUF899 family)